MLELARRHKTPLSILLVLLIGVAALAGLHRLVTEVRLSDIVAALGQIGHGRLLAAAGLTALFYFVLIGYDLLALKAVRRRLPFRTAALASFTSSALSYNLGLSFITGGTARYRVYTAAGVSRGDVARIITLASLTYWLGVTLLSGVALVFDPGALRLRNWQAPEAAQLALGLAILAATAAYLLLTLVRRTPLRIFGWTLPVPSTGMALMQFGLAAIDIMLATAAVYVLVPTADSIGFPAFVIAYLMAMLATIITHAPGGIGVFEAVILATLPGIDTATLLSALIAYRAIFYLLPFGLGTIMLAWHEGGYRRALRRVRQAGQAQR